MSIYVEYKYIHILSYFKLQCQVVVPVRPTDRASANGPCDHVMPMYLCMWVSNMYD